MSSSARSSTKHEGVAVMVSERTPTGAWNALSIAYIHRPINDLRVTKDANTTRPSSLFMSSKRLHRIIAFEASKTRGNLPKLHMSRKSLPYTRHKRDSNSQLSSYPQCNFLLSELAFGRRLHPPSNPRANDLGLYRDISLLCKIGILRECLCTHPLIILTC